MRAHSRHLEARRCSRRRSERRRPSNEREAEADKRQQPSPLPSWRNLRFAHHFTSIAVCKSGATIIVEHCDLSSRLVSYACIQLAIGVSRHASQRKNEQTDRAQRRERAKKMYACGGQPFARSSLGSTCATTGAAKKRRQKAAAAAAA